jgi:hypothetical protein
MTMGKLDEMCQQIVTEVDGAIACGIVDLETGMMMGVFHNVPYFTQDYLDAVAAASVDMFRGRNVSRIEQLIAKQRGTTPEHAFQEVFMSVIEGKNSLVVMVTKKSTNQGMGWSALRMGIGDIAPLLP